MKNRDMPAFPTDPNDARTFNGLTKLEYAAIKLLSGDTGTTVDAAVRKANRLFDALDGVDM